jgi:hypothetical protein
LDRTQILIDETVPLKTTSGIRAAGSLSVGDKINLYNDSTSGLGTLLGNGKSYQDSKIGSHGLQLELASLFVSKNKIAGIFNNQLCLVDALTGRVLKIYSEFNFPSHSLNHYGPFIGEDKSKLIFVTNGKVVVFSLKNESIINEFRLDINQNTAISAAKLSRDGASLYLMTDQGKMRIYDIMNGQILKEFSFNSDLLISIKGHRSHIVESSDGKFVFFINHDEGLKNQATSLVYDVEQQKVISPKNTGLNKFFSKAKQDTPGFSGVISALFSKDYIIVDQGTNGEKHYNAVSYSDHKYKVFNLKTQSWIKDFVSGSLDHLVQNALSSRIFDMFTSSVGLIVKKNIPDHSSKYEIQNAFDLLNYGYLPRLNVQDQFTGERVSLDLNEISRLHLVNFAASFNPTTIVFKAKYDKKFDTHLTYRRSNPTLESSLSAIYADQQESWFALDLTTRKVKRIFLNGFDQLSVQNPSAVDKLKLVGISPDFSHFIFADSNFEIKSFDVNL